MMPGARFRLRPVGSWKRCALLSSLVGLVACGGAIAVAFGRGAVRRGASGPLPIQVSVRFGRRSVLIPASFLGLSVEVSELGEYLQEGSVLDRALSLVRSAPSVPLRLRVGGISADDAYWGVHPLNAPAWVFQIQPSWLEQLGGLARRERLRVSLDVNLAVHSPSMATNFIQAAVGVLGRGGLDGVAIGNEPDLFAHQRGLDAERIASTLPGTPKDWTRGYSPARYRRDYVAYARALAAAVPGVPLMGPETTGPGATWIHSVLGLGRLGPRSLTVHRYAASSCFPANSRLYPRIGTLLSNQSSFGLAEGLARVVRVAQRSGMSLLVSEMNSTSCGGVPGVSDSFATTLWALDALFELVRAGVDGVNWHMRPLMLNAPFLLGGGTIDPLPELYGLAVFGQMTAPNTRLLAAIVSGPASASLKVWAVRSVTDTRVLLINRGQRAANVSIPAARLREPMTLQRLRAPGIGSRTGITLGGRYIGTDARWHGRPRMVTINPVRGSYHVRVSAYSAILLTSRRR